MKGIKKDAGYYDSQGIIVNPCSLNRGSKVKAVLIPKVRIISKLTQSTRIRLRHFS